MYFQQFVLIINVFVVVSLRFSTTVGDTPDRSLTSMLQDTVLVTDMGGVSVVTLDTGKPQVMPLIGYNDSEIRNVGANAHWENLGSKIVILETYLNQMEQENPHQLLVFIDGGDVIFGGCPGTDLSEIFHDTVRSGGNDTSKPKVVIGAEMGAFPSALMPRYRMFDERRESTVKGRWQNLDYKDFAECDRPEAPMGPCSDPPLYQFGNTGFIMGETRDFLRVLAGTTGFSNDQEGIIVYMMNHPEEVTLDYTGELVLNLHALKDSVLDVETYDDHNRNATRLRNRVTGRIQCFVHGNGNGKKRLRELAQLIG